MAYLVDTNVLLRRVRLSDPQHGAARAAIERLVSGGEILYIVAQNMIEAWNVLTRPVERNGFGMTPAQADAAVQQFENFFPILPETKMIYTHWRRLVVAHDVSGVQVHDARLVAAMLTHGVEHLLTFDTDDFKRFAEIVVVHPYDVPTAPAESK